MITRTRVLAAAGAASALLLLSGCSGTEPAPAAAHPVFDAPADEQPGLALTATQSARTVAFRQTLTFTTRHGATVLTSEGRMDLPAGRAAGAQTWKTAGGLPASLRERFLGASLGPDETQPATTGVAVDGQDVLVRPGEAGYWLRYTPADTFDEGNDNAVQSLRGTAVPFGGTLLDLVPGAGRVTSSEAAGGGRTYRATTTAPEALELFPPGVRSGLTRGMGDDSLPLPVTLEIGADAEGRLTRATADLAPLLGNENDGLAAVTALRAELTVSGHGTSAPELPPAAVQRTAADVVKDIHAVEPGACVDLATGMRDNSLIAEIPCGARPEARIFARPVLAGDHPGAKTANRSARAACGGEYIGAPKAWTATSEKKGSYWSVWPSEGAWGERGAARAACFVMLR
ncbi:hypothetical protein ACFTXJ_03455 [Streptomyces zhihengii]|uniref:hypothetical protein n=1 Tax=Streptomyces zhihengii TaxID=1818004 RepID=UPI00362579CC